MIKVKLEAELIEGHKKVTVVIVPFDPEQKWSKKLKRTRIRTGVGAIQADDPAEKRPRGCGRSLKSVRYSQP